MRGRGGGGWLGESQVGGTGVFSRGFRSWLMTIWQVSEGCERGLGLERIIWEVRGGSRRAVVLSEILWTVPEVSWDASLLAVA